MLLWREAMAKTVREPQNRTYLRAWQISNSCTQVRVSTLLLAWVSPRIPSERPDPHRRDRARERWLEGL